jgi:hypothetical protein
MLADLSATRRRIQSLADTTLTTALKNGTDRSTAAASQVCKLEEPDQSVYNTL